MAQISLYIDQKTYALLEDAARRQHSSISKWVGDLVRERVSPVYPPHFSELFGSIGDDSFHEPEDIPYGSDLTRLEL